MGANDKVAAAFHGADVDRLAAAIEAVMALADRYDIVAKMPQLSNLDKGDLEAAARDIRRVINEQLGES